jgi:Ca-activated chloride channel family protein
MRSFGWLVTVIGCLCMVTPPLANARGLLIPTDVKLPPLATVDHRVTATIDDQVAITTVEQTFRNHTDRPLEATYVFPVPRGASVNKFTMWVDGKETAGELLDAQKAQTIYTDIVRRTQDPGLLEYLGNDLMRLRVFPVPPRGDQKVRIQFVALARKEGHLVEYLYPLRSDGQMQETLKEFSVRVAIKSQHPITSVYSPTHAITVDRRGEREVAITFEKMQARLNKDFQLFYGISDQEIGLTPILYRPVSGDDGFFQFLISPRIEAMKSTRIPRDVVLVLDTSGSMSDLKMSQAKNALRYCLEKLEAGDRFGLISFATTVRSYQDSLVEASAEQRERAKKWVQDLRAGGGTAILPALKKAIEIAGNDTNRSVTIIFFTDGQPTVDETNPEKIVNQVISANGSNRRIFTFGVGDDVNAAMLDRLAESSRAVSTYVRPAEDIQEKVASLHNKISHPVLTNVKLSATNIRLSEIYPPELPDLFFGSQLVVIGRYSGEGPAAITLSGQVAGETRELVYEVNFPSRTDSDKSFVEDLWARRKVGYLLDQVRLHGESKELVDEITRLAKQYGIATPYTSYLVVPDAPLPVAGGGVIPHPGILRRNLPPVLQTPAAPGAEPGVRRLREFAKDLAEQANGRGGVSEQRSEVEQKALDAYAKALPPSAAARELAEAVRKTRDEADRFRQARDNFQQGKLAANQTGKLGVDLAQAAQNLRMQVQLTPTASRLVQGRNCVEIGGVWIDDGYTSATKTVTVKAQSPAYFRILELRPEMKELFQLGNFLVWMAPSGTALMIDANDGRDELTDDEIKHLFARPK